MEIPNIHQQLLRLKKNLQTYNPVALDNLHPSLTYEEIRSKIGGETNALDIEIVALYSWSNGSQVSYDGFRTQYNDKADFFPNHIFVDLDESLKQGRQAHPGIYLPNNIFGDSTYYIISPFISSFFLFPEAHSRLWLPHRTNLKEDDICPLLYESSRLDDPTEFRYDSLSNLLDHVSFMYENDIITLDVSGKNSPISSVDWILSQEYIYGNNPRCAELNQVCFSEPWPSKSGGF